MKTLTELMTVPKGFSRFGIPLNWSQGLAFKSILGARFGKD